MRARRLGGVALLAALGLWLSWDAPRDSASVKADRARGPELAERGARGGTSPAIRASSEVVETGSVTASGGPTSRAERLAARDEAEAQARANRQRLVFDTLSNLEGAAQRAERGGNPEYAAALRRRAEVLEQGLRTD